MKIYLLRHPKVAVSRSICYGRTDVDLAPGFEAAVGGLVGLPDLNEAKVYSSPAGRCRRVVDHLPGPPACHIDDRLQELDFGLWENRPWSELPEAELRAWSEDFAAIAPPQGETVRQMADRAMDFWSELTTADQDALVVAHTGWIRVLLSCLLETSIQKAFRLKIDFLGLTLIEVRGNWTEIHYINRTS